MSAPLNVGWETIQIGEGPHSLLGILREIGVNSNLDITGQIAAQAPACEKLRGI